MEFFCSKLLCLVETLKINGEKKENGSWRSPEQRVMVREQFQNPVLDILRITQH